MKTNHNSRRKIYENKLEQFHDVQNLETNTFDTENTHQLKNFSESLNINPNYSYLEILMAEQEHKNKNKRYDINHQNKKNFNNSTYSNVFCKIFKRRFAKKNVKSFIPNFTNGSSALIRFQTNTQKLKNKKEKISYTMNNTTKNSIRKDIKNNINKKNDLKKKYYALYSIPDMKNKIIKKKKIEDISDYETHSKINNTDIISPNEKICYNGLNKFRYINEDKKVKVNNLNGNNMNNVSKKHDISISDYDKKILKKYITDQKNFNNSINRPKNLNYPMNLKKKVKGKQISKYDNNEIKRKSFYEMINDKKKLLSVGLFNDDDINANKKDIKNNNISKNDIKEKNHKNKKISKHQPICSATSYKNTYKKNIFSKEMKKVNNEVIKIIDEKNNKICYKLKINFTSRKERRNLENEYNLAKTNPHKNDKIIKFKIPKRNNSSLYFTGLDLMRKIGNSVDKYYDSKYNSIINNNDERMSFDFLDKE